MEQLSVNSCLTETPEEKKEFERIEREQNSRVTKELECPDREVAVDTMVANATWGRTSTASVRELCSRLYDAGYRFQIEAVSR
ncbi:hypothetical protein JQC92_02440 [Shewanella sp. 202IG2-18]|uniref:hypothetical protein n=1 Tax=Parashewanella hymeniacidonis TaxID=2807618 RepID=UPI00195FC71C|nr:hypothetical protein [Parashewanella hymeniacidonis]MBM7070900.1 hypothetical protein [Parashewanella hymeniacidonis]